MINPALTIILPLKGRNEFTKRWFEYANKIRLPYLILIADGNPDTSLKAYLAEKKFEYLTYEYRHYQEGQGHTGYFKRLVDSLERVKTPLVLIAANDDFYSLPGVTACVDFLNAHPDYSVCSGKLIHFSVIPEWPITPHAGFVYGTAKFKHLEGNHLLSVEDDSATTRLINHCTHYAHTFYGIHRRDYLKQSCQLFLRSGITDIFMIEHFLTLTDVLQGKIKRLSMPYMARQRNSAASGKKDLYLNGPLEYRYYMSKAWRRDYNAMLEILSQEFHCSKQTLEQGYQAILNLKNSDHHSLLQKIKLLPRAIKLKLKIQILLNSFREFYKMHVKGYWNKLEKSKSCSCEFCHFIAQELTNAK